MKLPTPRRLNGKGFSHHFLMPVIAVIAVGVIGAAYLALSHAATLSVDLYQGNCAQKVQLLQSSAASADKTCTQQVQDLINIYQYAATNAFGISGSGEVFSYSGKTMVIMNGAYNGATQSAVNTLAKSPSLTNATSTTSTGTWQAFCTTVAGKKSTAAFTGHTTYDFSPGKNKATGYYIGSSGTTIFNNVCGSVKAKTFSTSGSTTTTAATHTCTNFTFSASSSTMGSSLTKPAPADCVRLIQTILNGTYQSNYKTYDSVADSFSSQTQTAKGLLTVDGKFGAATQSQLQAFQAVYNNLPVTGSVNSAANWTALCGEAISFKPDTATWKKSAYQDATNVFSGQSKPWSGCSTTAKQPTYSQHASAPTVGVPAPPKTTTPPVTGCTSNCGGGAATTPALVSFSYAEGLAGKDNGLPTDTYRFTWAARNTNDCALVINPAVSVVSGSAAASGSSVVLLNRSTSYTYSLNCYTSSNVGYLLKSGTLRTD